MKKVLSSSFTLLRLAVIVYLAIVFSTVERIHYPKTTKVAISQVK